MLRISIGGRRLDGGQSLIPKQTGWVMGTMRHRRNSTVAGIGLLIAVGMLWPAGAAQAATTTIDGPVDLGTSAAFGVLGADTVTNTGPSVINGDIGVSPGTAITGFAGAPDGIYTGALHQTDATAGGAQSDVTTAYNTAASLTPTTSGVAELDGLSLGPGVYAGGALSLANNGVLTLAGSASSVWVFQAASTLTIGSGSHIVVTGGATSCNVFWNVGSSATLGTTSHFVGTIMASQSVTANTGATIAGRLLANTAAVTLDSNVVTVPTGCAPAGAVATTESPAFTSGTPPKATVGSPYAFTVTATGTPAPTFTVSQGALPAGLHLNGVTGAITGTPTTTGSSTFTITAANGVAPAVSAPYLVTTSAAAPAVPISAPAVPNPTPTVATVPLQAGQATLAATGSDVGLPIAGGTLLLMAGVMLLSIRRARRRLTPRSM